MEQEFFNNANLYDIKSGIVPNEIAAIPSTPTLMDNLITFDHYPREEFYFMNCNHYFLKEYWIDNIKS